MLRRKLILILGSLIGVWLITALAAIVLLNGVLSDLDRVSNEAYAGSTATTQLAAAINAADVVLIRLAGGDQVQPEAYQDALGGLRVAVERFGEGGIVPRDSEVASVLIGSLGRFIEDLRATSPTSAEAPVRAQAMLGASLPMHDQIADYSRLIHERSQSQHARLVSRFRSVALGLGLTFLILINISILMLMRAAMMILQPVEKLVEATRRLGHEEFETRVEINRHDEFGELATAYNSLAEQLQSNERRKIETLHQVGTTLNHELNNAIAIIELQLRLADRAENAGNGRFQRIQETLGRMKRTIDALKHIRRVVLTDYTAGIKMLDLQRSIEDDGVDLASAEGQRAETSVADSPG